MQYLNPVGSVKDQLNIFMQATDGTVFNRVMITDIAGKVITELPVSSNCVTLPTKLIL